MERQPLVSIIMPAYNSESFIRGAIDSILGQTYQNIELIIINDGSKDDTKKIIKEKKQEDSRIIYIENEINRGICEVLNQGIERSKGKYIARMDSDDISIPVRIEKQVAYMEDNPEVVISGAGIEIFDQAKGRTGIRRYELNDSQIREKIFFYSPFCHPVVIMRADITKFCHYNPQLKDAEDYDLYFRLGQYGKFGNLSEILLKYRDNPEGVSRKRIRRQEALTLYIRVKAIFEYGYKAGFKEKLYWGLQIVSYYLLPSKVKIQLFRMVRDKKSV